MIIVCFDTSPNRPTTIWRTNPIDSKCLLHGPPLLPFAIPLYLTSNSTVVRWYCNLFGSFWRASPLRVCVWFSLNCTRYHHSKSSLPRDTSFWSLPEQSVSPCSHLVLEYAALLHSNRSATVMLFLSNAYWFVLICAAACSSRMAAVSRVSTPLSATIAAWTPSGSMKFIEMKRANSLYTSTAHFIFAQHMISCRKSFSLSCLFLQWSPHICDFMRPPPYPSTLFPDFPISFPSKMCILLFCIPFSISTLLRPRWQMSWGSLYKKVPWFLGIYLHVPICMLLL